MKLIQKILPQIVRGHVFMGSQCPAQLGHDLTLHWVRHIRIINFRNGVGLIHFITPFKRMV
nr:MAG TPA_asm: hypothetical protein [Caudoviricetes sp.]